MAQIIFDRDGKRLFVHAYFNPATFTSDEKPYLRSRNSEWALGVEKQLHEAGITSARAVVDFSLAPIGAGVVDVAQVDETINWAGIPWRVIPAKTGDGRYSYSFHDPDSNTEQTIIGASPQDVVDRLQIPHPIYLAHIASLPVFNPAPPPAPVVPQVEAGPIRILRHADQTMTLPERRVETAPRVSSQAFEKYVDSLSVAEYKEKLKDPEFASAVNALPVKK